MDQKRSKKIAEELLEPAEAAVKMQRLFKRAARELSSDYHLREDLVQEMSLAVLECGERHPLLIFMNRAVCRAINFLERNVDRQNREGQQTEVNLPHAGLFKRLHAILSLVSLGRTMAGFHRPGWVDARA